MAWQRAWEEPAFVAMSLLQKLAALAYYAAILASTLKFGELRWYLRGAWVRHYQQHKHDGAATPAG